MTVRRCPIWPYQTSAWRSSFSKRILIETPRTSICTTHGTETKIRANWPRALGIGITLIGDELNKVAHACELLDRKSEGLRENVICFLVQRGDLSFQNGWLIAKGGDCVLEYVL